MPKKYAIEPQKQYKVFRSANELTIALKKLNRRLPELHQLYVNYSHDKAKTVWDALKDTLKDIYGADSKEFADYEHDYFGGIAFNLSPAQLINTDRRECVKLLST
jgi:hypothetical protein